MSVFAFAILAFFVLTFIVLVTRDWRAGALFCLLYIYVEDLLRKVMPGQPAWMLLTKVPIILILYGSFLLAHMHGRGKKRTEWPLLAPILALTAVVFIQSFNVRLLDYRVAIIGWHSHVFYLPFLFLGYYYFRSLDSELRFFSHVGLLALLVGSLAIYHTATGGAPGVFSPLAGAHQMHSWRGGGVRYIAANFRTADILARHALFLLIINLAVSLPAKRSRTSWFNWLGFLFAAFCLGLAGRRLLFYCGCIGATGVFWYKFRHTLLSGSLRRVAFIVVALLVAGGMFYLASTVATPEDRHVARYLWLSVRAIPERFHAAMSHNLRSVAAVDGMGLGVGVASQGVQHAVGESTMGDTVHTTHGGPGQVWVEMGILGVLAYLWLHLALIQRGAKAVIRTAGSDVGVLAFAIFSFILLCNLVFIQAHSMFDDGGTLMFYWFSAGALLKAGTLSKPGKPRKLLRNQHTGQRPVGAQLSPLPANQPVGDRRAVARRDVTHNERGQNGW